MIAIAVIIQIIIGVLVGVLTAVLVNFREEWKKENDVKRLEDETIKQAMKEILGKFLDDMYSYYTEVGFIPLDKLHQARRIYDCYHSLGGNGTGTAEINKLELLPNNKEDIR